MKTFKQFINEEQLEEGKGARAAALALGLAGATLGGVGIGSQIAKHYNNQARTQELIQKRISDPSVPSRSSEFSSKEMGNFEKSIDRKLVPTDNAIGTMRLYREKTPTKGGPVIHPDAMIHMNLHGEPMTTKKSAGRFSFGGEPMWKGTPEAKAWSGQTKTQPELEDELIAKAKEAAKQYKKNK